MTLFRMFGIRVVPILHNTLWPSGFPPTGRGQRLVLKLDTPFWRRVPVATIGVSPECERQLDQLTKGHHPPMFQTRAQSCRSTSRRSRRLLPMTSVRSRSCSAAG